MDRHRLEAAGANYPQHHGLYGIPSGLLLVVLGISFLERAPGPVVLVVALALVGGIFGVVYLYYARTLGIVSSTPARRRQYNIAAVTSFTTFVVLDQLARTLLGRPPHEPISTTAAAYAVAAVVFHAMTVGVRPHRLVIWAGLLVGAVLPIWTTGPDRDALALLSIAATTMLSGLVEHVRLARWYRTYPGPGTTDRENDNARA